MSLQQRKWALKGFQVPLSRRGSQPPACKGHRALKLKSGLGFAVCPRDLLLYAMYSSHRLHAGFVPEP